MFFQFRVAVASQQERTSKENRSTERETLVKLIAKKVEVGT